MQWMKAHAVRRGIYCFVGVLIKAKKLCAVPPVPSQDYFFLIYSVVIDTFASPSATSDLVRQHKQAASQTVKHRFLYPPHLNLLLLMRCDVRSLSRHQA